MRNNPRTIIFVLLWIAQFSLSPVEACDGRFDIAPRGSVISPFYLSVYFGSLFYPLITFFLTILYLLRFRRNYVGCLVVFVLNSIFFIHMIGNIRWGRSSSDCSGYIKPAVEDALSCYQRGRFPVALHFWDGISGGTKPRCMTRDLGKECSHDSQCESRCLQTAGVDKDWSENHKALARSMYGRISRLLSDSSFTINLDAQGFCAAY